MKVSCNILCIYVRTYIIQIRNYGPTIRTQLVAESKKHQQVLWLFGEDQQLTEVGTMNLFVHWINENGGTQAQQLAT